MSDVQQACTFTKQLTLTVTRRYLLYLPKTYDPGQPGRWPLRIHSDSPPLCLSVEEAIRQLSVPFAICPSGLFMERTTQGYPYRKGRPWLMRYRHVVGT